MDKKTAEQVLQELRPAKFSFVKVKSAPARGSFKDLQDTIAYEDHYLADESILNFFDIDAADLTGLTADVKKAAAVGRLRSVLDGIQGEKTLATGGLEESSGCNPFLLISSCFLLPLAGNCVVNRRKYTEKVLTQFSRKYSPGKPPPTENIGIGNKYTWHGAPDARCNMQSVIGVLNQQTLDSKTNGESCISLAKTNGIMTDESHPCATATANGVMPSDSQINISNLNEVVGHAVVTSFTNGNRFPRTNPLVPATVLTEDGFVAAALYDRESDVLLHLKHTSAYSCQYFDIKEKKFCTSGVVLLWLLLHHQLFLKPLNATQQKIKSGLKDILEAFDALKNFEELERMDRHYSDYHYSYPKCPLPMSKSTKRKLHFQPPASFKLVDGEDTLEPAAHKRMRFNNHF